MRREMAFWAALAFAVVVALLDARPPAPLPASASPTAFSAERAFADVRAIARAPHPTGSAEAARVRATIAGRMRALGLQVSLHPGEGMETPKWAPGFVSAGRVDNVVGVLPGRDPRLPALALMAHSDSVPNSPGAADDTAGVATALETVRALEASGPTARDVIVLITDGEEPGLLGAEAFFRADPLRRRIGVLINMDTRGGAGRAQMFETAPRAGALFDLYRGVSPGATANSLAATIYHHMPNGTDFTHALGAGIGGLNFAFEDDQFDYHTAHITPAALDRRALQSMGDQVLGSARALAGATTLPGPAPDLVYANLPLLGLAAYPAWAGWGLIALGAALLAFVAVSARRRGLVSLSGPVLGALTTVGATLAAGLVLYGAGWLAGMRGYGDVQRRYALLAHYPVVFAGMALLSVGTALALLRFAGRWLGAWSLAIGALALVLLVATLLQALAPQTAHAFAWPLLPALAAAAVAMALGGELDRPAPLAVVAVGAALGLALVAGLGLLLFGAVGVDIPAAFALVVLLGTPVAAVLASGQGRSVDAVSPALAAAAGAALLAWGASAGGTAARPALTSAFYLADPAKGLYLRADPLARLDPWARATLTADGGAITRAELAPSFGPLWQARARPTPLTAPGIVFGRDGERVRVTLTPRNGGRSLASELRVDGAVADVRLDGLPAPLLVRPNAWSDLAFAAPPPGGVTVSFRPAGAHRLSVETVEVIDGWPAGAAAPPKPETVQGWQGSDTTRVRAEGAFGF